MFIENESKWPLLAAELLKRFPQGAVIGLSGGLGAGKTTFVRAFISQICEKTGAKSPRVLSPTFVFHQPYPELAPPVDHFDLYRMEGINERSLQELGVMDAVDSAREKQGFVFIEWPEKILPGVFKFDVVVTWQGSETGRTVLLSDSPQTEYLD